MTDRLTGAEGGMDGGAKGRRPLSPQEKKARSLAKDRRNDYGQNDKAARRLIPLMKAKAMRAVRHADRQAVAAALADGGADDTPAPLTPALKQRWRKAPDVPLGVVIARQARLRSALEDTADEGGGRARLQRRQPSGLSKATRQTQPLDTGEP